jgi:hypothetical protein
MPQSFAGMGERDWYMGTGKIIGFGSDDEPLIEPLGEWRRFAKKTDSDMQRVVKARIVSKKLKR